MSVVSDEALAQQAIQARCFHPSGAWTAFPQSTLEGSVVARFEEMVALYPERLAVWHADLQLTYAELNQQANRVAQRIVALASDPARPVILLFSHTPAAVIALFAVLKAGRFYTPFDPAQPAARLAHKAGDSEANLLLTEEKHLPLANAVNRTGATILCVDKGGDAIADERTTLKPQQPISAETTALLLYTSGSTGQPKGIVLNHRTLLHRVKRQQAIVHLGSEDRCACVHTYDAIAGLRDLLCPLLNGAATYLFDLKTRSLAELPLWVQQQGITILGFVTPTFRQWLHLLTPGMSFAQVRLICIGGDTLYQQDVEHYRQCFASTCVLYNSLGATETAGGFCYYLFDHESPLPENPLPVGYPMLDMHMLILDDAGQPVADGKTGEIALRTSYLAQGYWRQPAQTAARFRSTAFGNIYTTGDQGLLHGAGCLIHLGRSDNQVKIRGYRVELGEVERSLLGHPAVQEAVVVAHGREQGETHLIAYWVAKPTLPSTPKELRAWLKEKLPSYMIPSLFVALTALPLTPNGKLDRHSLPAPDFTLANREILAFPRTPTEQALTELWRALLKVEQIGIDDDFFELGGHSLLAVRLLAQVEQQFQQPIMLRDFVFNPTIAHLATLLNAPQARSVAIQSGIQNSEATALALTGPEVDPLRALYDTLADKDKLARLRQAALPQQVRPRLLERLLSLPQPIFLQLLEWALQQPWAQRRYLPKQMALVQQFLAGLEAPVQQQKAVSRSLFFGFLIHFSLREAIFQRMQTEGRAMPVEGLERLEAARRQHQPVILLRQHTYQNLYFGMLKLTQGGVGGLELLIRNAQLDPRTSRHVLYAHQLELAYRTLEGGGVIDISPDVNRGLGPQISVAFHGRMRSFRTSFAELALLTHAQLFFVASDLQSYNQFSFRLVGPFDLGGKAMTHEERVHHLMAQYVAQLKCSGPRIRGRCLGG